MRHLKLMILSLVTVLGNLSAHALEIEITEGVEGALPIAIVPFAYRGAGNPPAQDVAAVVTADLARSGRFKPLPLADMLARPSTTDAVDFRDWRAVSVENLVIGEIEPNGPLGYLVKFRLFDVFRGGQITGFSFPTTQNDLRSTAHHIADLIYEELIGERGAFDTRIAYITSVRDRQGHDRMHLKVADADGDNPQTIVASDEPLMSPAWSPDGKRIAYVSFEKHQPSIWVQDVFTGKRERITSYRGINGAPAWSPDGRRLALTLSKDGNPDIYIFDLRRRSLRKLTRHWAIDTEPAWSPDGKSIVFTSDRGGTPQIYRVPVSGGEPERITFEGNYNARASWAADGRYLTLVTRVNGNFRIGLLDMENGNLQVLSQGDLDESPSFAPNGSMIIYAGRDDGRDVLWAVSTDGRVRQRLATQVGDVREPTWSPYHQQRRGSDR